MEDQMKRENNNLFDRNQNLERIVSDNRQEINNLNGKYESLRYESDARNNKQETEIFTLNKISEDLRENKSNLESQLSDQTNKR